MSNKLNLKLTNSTGTRLIERIILPLEKISKEVVFDCRMCGQCMLQVTGLTCPMRCPKNLRNGPCGGVRPDGNCEVYPDKPCVWVQGIERAARLPVWRGRIRELQPPVDWQLKDTSSWINWFSGRDAVYPPGWTVED
ncbi:MAG TPA: methylenetetrahydrofolate reductase C-terminal domain-containing protein [Anaerolineales bacterium]|nr:methylenetetrahydrofolate reductase C-terminal domain-containing protein [Anaerolineales bacterium]